MDGLEAFHEFAQRKTTVRSNSANNVNIDALFKVARAWCHDNCGGVKPSHEEMRAYLTAAGHIERTEKNIFSGFSLLPRQIEHIISERDQ